MRGTTLSGKPELASAQLISMVVKVLWFALLIICTVTELAPYSFAAKPNGPLTVRVRQTGGGALSGASVCVQYEGGRQRFCTTNPSGTSRSGIATVPNVVHGNVTVIVEKAGFTNQERTIVFNSRTRTLQFILSPANASTSLPGFIDVSVSGQATQGIGQYFSITWRTDRPFSYHVVTDEAAVPNGGNYWGWVAGPPRTEQTVLTSMPGGPLGPWVRGQIYRKYVHVRSTREGEIATREVQVRYGQAPRQPQRRPRAAAQDYVVSGQSAVAQVIALADQRGFERTASPTSHCTFGRRAVMFATYVNSPSFFLPQPNCEFVFFGGAGGSTRLAAGWYLKDVKVESIRLGSADLCGGGGGYLYIRPQPSSRSLRFTVKARPDLPPRCVYAITELTFRGPQNATSWRAAFR